MANWWKLKQRGNVEDRRGMSGGVAAGGIGIAGFAIVIAVGLLGGEDQALEILDILQDSNQTTEQRNYNTEFDGEDSYEIFTSTVLGSNNALWDNAFSSSGLNYKEPRLVLFRDFTTSSCGGANSRIGPHYCPTDNTIYLDESFFKELETRLGAKGGDVAEAYVISHEVGHHIQHELGILDKVNEIRVNNPDEYNKESIKLELQADCFAGIWANSIANLGVLEEGEIGEAIDAAASVGDNRVQKSSFSKINPETWTHGSSEDRKKWFNIGYEYGDFEKCNTFK